MWADAEFIMPYAESIAFWFAGSFELRKLLPMKNLEPLGDAWPRPLLLARLCSIYSANWLMSTWGPVFRGWFSAAFVWSTG